MVVNLAVNVLLLTVNRQSRAGGSSVASSRARPYFQPASTRQLRSLPTPFGQGRLWQCVVRKTMVLGGESRFGGESGQQTKRGHLICSASGGQRAGPAVWESCRGPTAPGNSVRDRRHLPHPVEVRTCCWGNDRGGAGGCPGCHNALLRGFDEIHQRPRLLGFGSNRGRRSSPLCRLPSHWARAALRLPCRRAQYQSATLSAIGFRTEKKRNDWNGFSCEKKRNTPGRSIASFGVTAGADTSFIRRSTGSCPATGG